MIAYNIIASNPNLTKKPSSRIKIWKDSNHPWKVFLRVYGFTAVFFLVIFGINFLMIDFKENPSVFDFMFVMLVVMNVVQTNSSYYNIFYESDDVSMYAPLPISLRDVYFSKLVGVGATTAIFDFALIPLIASYLHSTGLGGHNPWANWGISTVISFVFAVGITMILIVFNSYLNALLTSKKVFVRNKKLVQTISQVILVLSAACAGIGFSLISRRPQLFAHVPRLLSSAMSTRLGVLVTTGCLLILACALWWLMMKNIAANYGKNVEFITTVTAEKEGEDKAKRKIQIGGSLNKQLIKFNLGLIADPTLLVQIVGNGPLMSVLMLFTMNFAMSEYDGGATGFGYGFAVIMGTIIGTMSNLSILSLPAVMFSLEKENADYIRSLPISRSRYFRLKIVLAVMVIAPMVLIPLEIILWIKGCSLFNMLLGAAAYILEAVPLAIIFGAYDAKNVYTNWHNVADLISGSRKTKAVVLILVFFPFSVALLVMSLLGLMSNMVQLIISLVVVAITWIVASVYKRNFEDLNV